MFHVEQLGQPLRGCSTWNAEMMGFERKKSWSPNQRLCLPEAQKRSFTMLRQPLWTWSSWFIG